MNRCFPKKKHKIFIECNASLKGQPSCEIPEAQNREATEISLERCLKTLHVGGVDAINTSFFMNNS